MCFEGEKEKVCSYDNCPIRLDLKRDEVLDLLVETVNQACSSDGVLCTFAISSYEDAMEYLVKIGILEWVKEGFTAKFKRKEGE